jgi:hypothetical protein
MDTFMVLERATMQWLVQRYQHRTLRRAANQAYLQFARTYPEAVATLFDLHFIKTHLLPLLMSAADQGSQVTATQIAELWARQISLMPSLREKHTARMMPVATHFLCMVADELTEIQIGHDANLLNVHPFAETAVG